MNLDDYRKSLLLRNYQPSTLKKNVQLAACFMRHVRDTKHINALSLHDYLTDLQERGRTIKTVKNHLSAIKVFCDYLAMRGLIKENPANRLVSLNLPEEIPVCLSDSELHRVYEVAKEHDMLCEVTLALKTGMRMEEMRFLQWEDIDFARKQLIVKKTKSKRPRTIPLNQDVLEQLRHQRNRFGKLLYVFPAGRGGPGNRHVWTLPRYRGINWWSKKSIKIFQTHIPTLKNLPTGNTGRGWHALRHTFATRAVKADIDLLTVRDWMGHRKLETTMRYVHMARHYDERIELI